MKNEFQTSKPLLLAALLAIVFTAAAWQSRDKNGKTNKSAKAGSISGDTIKPRIHNSDTNEFELKGLDESMKGLDLQLESLNIELKKIEFDKIEKQVKEALSQVDFKQINREVAESLQKVDWNKIKSEVDIELKKAQAEIAQVDVKKVQADIEAAQKELSSEAIAEKINVEKIHAEVEEELHKARKEIKKAKENILNLHEFTNALTADGLIEKNKPYTIQLKDGILFINGKKQSKETTDKYNKYYGDKKDFSYKSNHNSDEPETDEDQTDL